jgi:hypothetical protein
MARPLARFDPRESMMHTAPPLETFVGHLKFHRSEVLTALGTAVMQFGFPDFLELPKPTAEMLEGMRRHRDMGAEFVAWENRQPRRYAADTTLPRGCYFSVCRSAEGDDGGTVANELNAYREPEKTGLVLAFDLMSQIARDALRIEGGPRHAFGIFIKDARGFFEVYQSVYEECDLPKTGDSSLVVEIPYQVESREIECVLDMRQPKTQRWFFDNFHLGDGEALEKPNGANIQSFAQMLPTLMSLEQGGNITTQAIGAWMRTHDVNALIFPSARSNAAVKIEDGNLTDWYGWNLVDYRSAAERLDFTKWVDLSPWELKVHEGFECSIAPCDSKFVGSWKIMGREDFLERSFAQRAGVKT